MRKRELFVALADARNICRHVGQLPRYQVDNLPLPLNTPLNCDHRCTKDDPALAFVQRGPDHKIGHAASIFNGDEHDAFRRAWLLPGEDDPGRRQPLAVASRYRAGADADALGGEFVAQECERMVEPLSLNEGYFDVTENLQDIAAKFNALGIQTGLDIRNQPLALLEAHFGKSGTYYYWISRGIDERPVRANRI